MAPQSPELHPDGFGSKVLQSPNESLSMEGEPRLPTQEHMDSTQADVVREKLVSEAAGLVQATPATNQQSSAVSQKTAKDLVAMTPEDQIEHLVGIAHTNGLEHAFKMANATNNAYVIDRFHDELVNRVLHNKQQSM